ncbi:G_PROTEIN_RECEP_F1_2 domain-containing protein [Meloidogyne graminicola]|uniref:G_PROTEIN_RECEP_F1_2 domain-containing protein n=1 Tax=Meloidogyne graminicola TaxID=189291 RepID=A0A8S9ZLQ2_9BILA|nr:G_PROTEIN_RECEP_F1_2 domain-containing protein [Meloidogyne graminicola]
MQQSNIWLISSVFRILVKNYIPVIILRQMSLYILMLAFVDLMVILTIPMHIHSMLTGHWNFGTFGCKLLVSVENINKLLSVMVLTCMSVERFIVICRPFEYWSISIINRKRRMFDSFILLTILLITVIIFCSPFIYYANVSRQFYVFFNGDVQQGNDLCSSHLPERLMMVFISYMVFFGFLVPFPLIIFCYICIIHRLKKKPNGLTFSTYSKSAVRSILRVIIFHFICWTPFWIFVSLPLLSHFKLINIEPIFDFLPFARLINIVGNILPFANSSFNWIFYGMMNSQLRDSNNLIGSRNAYMSLAMLPRTTSFSVGLNKRRSTRSTRSLIATSQL